MLETVSPLELQNNKNDKQRVLYAQVLGVFMMGVIVTLLVWTLLPAHLRESDNKDYPDYYEPVARNILAGKGFVRPDGGLAINYPPGYPVLLAGVFGLAHLSRLSESLVQGIFVLLYIGISSVILFLFSLNVWGRRYAWWTAILFITYPFLLWLTKEPNVEIPFMIFFYGSIYTFWLGFTREKSSWLFYAISGILTGLAMLIRPIAVGLGVLLACFALFSRQYPFRFKLFLALVLVAANVLVILPWEIWMHSQNGQWILLSTRGVPSIRDGLIFAVDSSKSYRMKIPVPDDVYALQRELMPEVAPIHSLGGIAQVL